MNKFKITHTETGEKLIALENIFDDKSEFKFRLIKERDLNPFSGKIEYSKETISGQVYIHSKTDRAYVVLGYAISNEDYKPYVIYRRIRDKEEFYARPRKMFHELVEINDKKVPRFKLGSDIVNFRK